MTAPNPAVDALPGWRGADPDGGTWVRLMSAAGTGNPIPVWRYVSPSGGSDYRRTQEEAEAAGLEPLYAASDFEAQGWERVAECVKDCPVCCAVLTPAAPAPLDPGNPEHLREVDKFLGRFYASIGIASSSAGSVCKQLRSVADRLDREQREAEQDAADRKRAEEYANGFEDATPDDRRGLRQGYLAGIRAERACQADLAAIELPTPNEREDDDTATTWGEPYNDLQVGVHDEYADQVQVWVDYEPIEPWSPHEAEEFASHLLAAAKRARQEAGQ